MLSDLANASPLVQLIVIVVAVIVAFGVLRWLFRLATRLVACGVSLILLAGLAWLAFHWISGG